MQSSVLFRPNVLRQAKNVMTTISSRLVSTTVSRKGSFKVQDDKDFLEKVEKSKDTIIVDFFAK